MSQLFSDLMVLGITGKIGSGKSEVTSILSENGFVVVDCDEIVHELYQVDGWGTQKIRTFFGESYLNKKGEVSRQRLLRTLIKSSKKWEILDRMIHPLVAEKLKRKMRTFKPGKVALEIQIYTPHLFKPFIDHLWLVQANEDLRIERVKHRGLSVDQIQAIGRQQKESHFEDSVILENNHDRLTLEKNIKDLLKTLP